MMNDLNENSCKCEVEENIINGETSTFDEDSCSAPVEVLADFLSSVMARNYKTALYYCKLILQYEPENEVVQDFYPLIQEKIYSGVNDESDSFADEEMSTLSDASTEYFTSPSVASANTSISSSFSSDEDDISLEPSDE